MNFGIIAELRLGTLSKTANNKTTLPFRQDLRSPANVRWHKTPWRVKEFE